MKTDTMKRIERLETMAGTISPAGYGPQVGIYNLQQRDQITMAGGMVVTLGEFEQLPGAKVYIPDNGRGEVRAAQ